MVYIQLERRGLLALNLLFISRNGFSSTNFPTAFRLFFFFLLVFFPLFCLCQFLSYFLDVGFASLSSFTHSSLPPPPQTRGNNHLFCSRPFVGLFARSWLTQKVRGLAVLWSERLCTDWRFSVVETLAVILSSRWQVKRPKVPFDRVSKENVFSAK